MREMERDEGRLEEDRGGCMINLCELFSLHIAY